MPHRTSSPFLNCGTTLSFCFVLVLLFTVVVDGTSFQTFRFYAGFFSGTVYGYTLTDDGSVTNTKFIADTRACFDNCPSINAWGTGGLTILQILGLYNPGSSFFLIDSDLSATQIPDLNAIPVNNDETPLAWLYYLDNTTRKYTNAIGKWDPKAGKAINIAVNPTPMGPYFPYFDPIENTVYSIPYYFGSLSPTTLQTWNLGTNKMNFVNVSDQKVGYVGFAYSQTLQTPFMLCNNGTIFSIDKTSGLLTTFSSPPSTTQIMPFTNTFVVDNSEQKLYYLSTGSVFVSVDLKTKMSVATTVSDEHGYAMVSLPDSQK